MFQVLLIISVLQLVQASHLLRHLRFRRPSPLVHPYMWRRCCSTPSDGSGGGRVELVIDAVYKVVEIGFPIGEAPRAVVGSSP